jgi:hypothetical protein
MIAYCEDKLKRIYRDGMILDYFLLVRCHPPQCTHSYMSSSTFVSVNIPVSAAYCACFSVGKRRFSRHATYSVDAISGVEDAICSVFLGFFG